MREKARLGDGPAGSPFFGVMAAAGGERGEQQASDGA